MPVPKCRSGAPSGTPGPASRLRALLADRCRSAGIELTVPPVNLCTDNGAMVAALGARLVRDGVAPSDAWFGADPGQPVEVVSV